MRCQNQQRHAADVVSHRKTVGARLRRAIFAQQSCAYKVFWRALGNPGWIYSALL
jgi:hypothetical protein